MYVEGYLCCLLFDCGSVVVISTVGLQVLSCSQFSIQYEQHRSGVAPYLDLEG